MFNHSIRKWIPENRREEATMQQFADAVDWLLSVDYPYSDKLAQRFYSVKSKYRNLKDIPLEDVYALINEFGYGYIVDTLYLDEDAVRTFLSFINFIHINKGSRKGFEFALKLLEIDFQLSEWYEQTPTGEPHTISLDLVSFSPTKVRGFEVIDKIVNFARNYIYPVINKMTLEFSLDKSTYYIGVVNQGTVQYTAYPDTIYLIWDVHQWDEKLWYWSIDYLIWDVSTGWDSSKWNW